MNSGLGIELYGVLLFALAGLICAWISDVLFLLRYVVFRGRLAEFLLDILCMAICSLAVFLTTVSALQENLRGYMLISFAASAFVWEQTLGRLLRKLLCAVVQLPIRAVRYLAGGVRRILCRCGQRLRSVRKEKSRKKTEKDANKTFLFFKNRLK